MTPKKPKGIFNAQYIPKDEDPSFYMDPDSGSAGKKDPGPTLNWNENHVYAGLYSVQNENNFINPLLQVRSGSNVKSAGLFI